MTGNDAVEIARRFHDGTMHTPDSVRTSTHALEWDIKPFPFKVYTDAPAVALPRDLDALTVPALAAIADAAGPAARLTLTALAGLLYHAAGVTKKKTYPGGGEVLFRAAPSTGALYQTEVYVIAGEVDGLPPGVYHFCPGDFVLRRLREGDLRAVVATAAVDDTPGRRAATLALTAIYWRNTWKYQARGFRHLYWDSGSMLANALAVGGALGLTPRLLTGFVDADVNHLLGLDPDREAALELVALGPAGGAAPASPAPLPAIDPPVMPLSSEEVDYPALRAMQQASALGDPAAVRAWRGRAAPSRAAPLGPVTPLPPVDPHAGRSLGETIQRRGSTRQFSHAALTAEELAAALWAATRSMDADVAGGLVDLYLVVNAVDDVAPGAYAVWPDAGLELLRADDLRRRSAHLCLGQALGGDAAAVIFFLAPLDALLAAFGNRGYRLANLQAGLAGGRAYLAAYARGFGASGLTFYDHEVMQLFSPHAAGKDAIFVTALGRAASGAGDVLVSSRAIQPPRRA